MHSPDEILREWFSDASRWLKQSPTFDDHLRQTYGDDVEAAVRGDIDAWVATPRGALALVILLDQFTRSIYRGTGRMYGGDEKALTVALGVIDRGEDRSLPEPQRHFLYMPLMHSEDRAVQERSLQKFAELSDRFKSANGHSEIAFRFGRFPHRNTILGRASTPEEIEFLKQPGSSF